MRLLEGYVNCTCKNKLPCSSKGDLPKEKEEHYLGKIDTF